MRIKNFVILFISGCVISVLNACVGGNGALTQNQNTSNLASATKHVQSTTADLTAIPSADLAVNINSSCSYSASNPLKICSNNNQICATLTTCPTASFASGYAGVDYWVSPEMAISGNTFKLTFNADVESSFHITEIYNDLQGNGVIGKIEQIDYTQCQQVLHSGSTKGKSCNISFMYQGNLMKSISNDLHILFKDNGNSNNLDFHFPITNTYFSNQNVPIVNISSQHDIDYLINSASEDSNNKGLTYNSSFTQHLVNNGMGNLTPISGSLPDINIMTGTQFSPTLSTLYFGNSLMTSCGNATIAGAGTCDFPFYNFDLLNSSTITSQIGRFGFQYLSFANRVTYTKQVVVGVGDIRPKDYVIPNYNHSPATIILEKQNYGNPGLTYNIPLKNFKLYVKYMPEFYIATASDDKQLKYAYGDYVADSLTAEELVKNVTLDYDSNCFSSGFDANYDTSLDTIKCPVRINFNKSDAKPLGMQLYASYNTPIGNRHIEQFIGNISSNDAQLPDGTYKDNFYNIKYEDGVLSGTMRSLAPFMSFLNYNEQCASNSTVGVIHNTSNNLTLMKCDTLAAKFPQGSYSNSCTNVEFDGNHLSALCQVDGQSGGEIFVDGKLDYAQQCKANSAVSNNHGHLQCDVNK